MKPLFLSIALLANGCLLAQSKVRTIDDILNQPEKKTAVYKIANSYLKSAVINMSFGESSVLSVMNKTELKSADIVRIDLVFTDYPKTMDLKELNRGRIQKALEIRPDLVKDSLISWQMVRQMSCNNESEAKLLFHGVVIYYVAPQNAALSQQEQLEYQNLPKDGSYKVTPKDLKSFKDSTVLAAFTRNKQWKHPTIVADVTCSMYPYISQTAFWFLLKMNRKENCNIVFFNDGDAEENGIEAILEAQEKFPYSKEIIFIADNYADLRDFELISKIKIPVRVILCGVEFGVNVQYINLAHKTGGSLHTMEKDLNNLVDMSEGKTFVFLGKTYIILNGEVVLKSNVIKQS
ncbi:MAG TPA: hypothetical protein PKN22_06470 [Taishania sp.]|nr:hypothetical protein [Taishania sp.]